MRKGLFALQIHKRHCKTRPGSFKCIIVLHISIIIRYWYWLLLILHHDITSYTELNPENNNTHCQRPEHTLSRATGKHTYRPHMRSKCRAAAKPALYTSSFSSVRDLEPISVRSPSSRTLLPSPDRAYCSLPPT